MVSPSVQLVRSPAQESPRTQALRSPRDLTSLGAALHRLPPVLRDPAWVLDTLHTELDPDGALGPWRAQAQRRRGWPTQDLVWVVTVEIGSKRARFADPELEHAALGAFQKLATELGERTTPERGVARSEGTARRSHAPRHFLPAASTLSTTRRS